MWREKKIRPEVAPNVKPEVPSVKPMAPPPPPYMETTMNETTSRLASTTPASQRHTVLGQAVTVKGELSASEDLLIEGQFEGTLTVEDHCLTVGTEGQVKAEIRARQVVILGAVTGKIVAREKVEIRRSGRLMGDLTTGAVAIEEGAYFKGSIDILREDAEEGSRSKFPPSTLDSSA
jgi:cytoskeletal protein CcmA (bactofilin family)